VVAEARDGEEAVSLAAEHDPDLIVMDVRMPHLDGIEAARQISDRKPVPIVMLTAYAEEDLVTRASEAGAFAYLVKPFREVDLLPALNTARARFEELSALREEAADLTEALASRKAVERAKGILMRKDGIDEAEAFRRIRAASQKTGRTMRVVADALIATFETDVAE
jgi:response regulator NasT